MLTYVCSHMYTHRLLFLRQRMTSAARYGDCLVAVATGEHEFIYICTDIYSSICLSIYLSIYPSISICMWWVKPNPNLVFSRQRMTSAARYELNLVFSSFLGSELTLRLHATGISSLQSRRVRWTHIYTYIYICIHAYIYINTYIYIPSHSVS